MRLNLNLIRWKKTNLKFSELCFDWSNSNSILISIFNLNTGIRDVKIKFRIIENKLKTFFDYNFFIILINSFIIISVTDMYL